MADFTLTAVADKPYLLESPLDMVEGEIYVFTITVSHATSVSSPVTTAFLNDVAFTTGISGSDGTSGNRITSKTFTPTADTRGDYVLNFKYVNGSQTEYRKLLCRVALQEDSP